MSEEQEGERTCIITQDRGDSREGSIQRIQIYHR